MSTVEVQVQEFAACKAVSITKNITVPDFHAWIPHVLGQLHGYIQEAGGAIAGDPICFYHGPINENDSGPAEVCWPFTGDIEPSGEIVVREIPAHQAAVGKANKEQSQFPIILDVWSDVAGWVQENGKTLTEETLCCYEVWPEDHTIHVVMPFE